MGQRLAAVAAAAALIALVPDAGYARRPLQPLREWGAGTARSFERGETGARAVEARLRALRGVTHRAAPGLRRASATARATDLALSRVALAASLEPALARLSGARRYLFYLAYQGQLERLAERAGLERAPTGRALKPGGAVADSDGDGIVDGIEADDDGDGIPDRLDASDMGWGIPDAFQVREDGQSDDVQWAVGRSLAALTAAPVARPRARGYCVWATEAVPALTSVRAVGAWRARALRRGCAPPVAPPVRASHGARSRRRPDASRLNSRPPRCRSARCGSRCA